jgi:hypothetical protein
MDYSHFRRSKNIDDRRADNFTTDQVQYAEREIFVLSRYGALAEQGKLPFLCPSLKTAARDAATLGKLLAAAKTPYKLIADYKKAATDAISSTARGGDSCEGAKLEMLAMDDASIGVVDSAMATAKAAHSESVVLASKITIAIVSKRSNPSMGDKINNALSECPKYALDYQKALAAYRDQIVSLTLYYRNFRSFQLRDRDDVAQMQCSTFNDGGSVGSSVSTSTTQQSGIAGP